MKTKCSAGATWLACSACFGYYRESEAADQREEPEKLVWNFYKSVPEVRKKHQLSIDASVSFQNLFAAPPSEAEPC